MYDVLNDLNLCPKVNIFSCVLNCLLNIYLTGVSIMQGTLFLVSCQSALCKKIGIGWTERMYNLRKLAVTLLF